MSDTCKALNLDLASLRQVCITVEEREHMDATFMLLSLVHLFLEESGGNFSYNTETKMNGGGGHVVLVLFQNNFQHMNNIAMKLFINLKSLIQTQKLTLLEFTSEEMPVQKMFNSIYNSMNSIKARDKLVIFTNMNNLTYMGASSQDVVNFSHYIKHTFRDSTCVFHCTQNKGDSIIGNINNAVKHLSSYVLEVSNLRTGFCKEISGYINISNKYKSYKKIHHFLFTSRGVNVFLPGGLSTR